jgi:hypothetical protein
MNNIYLVYAKVRSKGPLGLLSSERGQIVVARNKAEARLAYREWWHRETRQDSPEEIIASSLPMGRTRVVDPYTEVGLLEYGGHDPQTPNAIDKLKQGRRVLGEALGLS